jgi:hypothetical protein
VSAYRQAPHRAAAREQIAERRPVALRRMLAEGLPASGAEGLRLALEPGRGRTAVPVRSVMAGAVLAMTVVTATLTFGASLAALVSHPALYGWNFSYAFYAVQGWGAVPARWADPLLAHDRLVAATTGVDFPTVQIDGQTVPAMAAPTRPAVAPHLLSGHGVDGNPAQPASGGRARPPVFRSSIVHWESCGQRRFRLRWLGDVTAGPARLGRQARPGTVGGRPCSSRVRGSIR